MERSCVFAAPQQTAAPHGDPATDSPPSPQPPAAAARQLLAAQAGAYTHSAAAAAAGGDQGASSAGAAPAAELAPGAGCSRASCRRSASSCSSRAASCWRRALTSCGGATQHARSALRQAQHSAGCQASGSDPCVPGEGAGLWWCGLKEGETGVGGPARGAPGGGAARRRGGLTSSSCAAGGPPCSAAPSPGSPPDAPLGPGTAAAAAAAAAPASAGASAAGGAPPPLAPPAVAGRGPASLPRGPLVAGCRVLTPPACTHARPGTPRGVGGGVSGRALEASLLLRV